MNLNGDLWEWSSQQHVAGSWFVPKRVILLHVAARKNDSCATYGRHDQTTSCAKRDANATTILEQLIGGVDRLTSSYAKEFTSVATSLCGVAINSLDVMRPLCTHQLESTLAFLREELALRSPRHPMLSISRWWPQLHLDWVMLKTRYRGEKPPAALESHEPILRLVARAWRLAKIPDRAVFAAERR